MHLGGAVRADVAGRDRCAKPGACSTATTFWPHAAETARGFCYRALLALVGGLAIGLALGLNRTGAEVTEPILVALYSLPKITLYPVILLVFGLGISAKIAFGAIHGIIPMRSSP